MPPRLTCTGLKLLQRILGR